MCERLSTKERGADWQKEINLQDVVHTINGGALPLITNEQYKSFLVVSELPQDEDHLFAVEVLREILARKSEEF